MEDRSSCAYKTTCAEERDEVNWQLPGRVAGDTTAPAWELFPRAAKRLPVANEAGTQAHAAAACSAEHGCTGCTADEGTAASAGTAGTAAEGRRAAAGHGGRRKG
jgi:hypothetical protein